MTTANRDNSAKPQVSQVRHFAKALEELAGVMTQGREKYPDTPDGKPNWTLGGKPDEEYLDCADRHINAYVLGEIYDYESGRHHLAHAVWNLLALMTLNWNGNPRRKVRTRKPRKT